MWLDYYAENTPGVEVVDNATTILGWKSEPQPDVMLRVKPKWGGRTQDKKGFVPSVPRSWLSEVAKATRYVDLGPKLADYEQAGVVEYIVRALKPDEILWFEQQQGALATRQMTPMDSTDRQVFPGCGSTQRLFSRAIGGDFVPWSTSVALRPNTPRSSLGWLRSGRPLEWSVVRCPLSEVPT